MAKPPTTSPRGEDPAGLAELEDRLFDLGVVAVGDGPDEVADAAEERVDPGGMPTLLVARPVLGVGANRRFGCGGSTFSDAVGSTLTR